MQKLIGALGRDPRGALMQRQAAQQQQRQRQGMPQPTQQPQMLLSTPQEQQQYQAPYQQQQQQPTAYAGGSPWFDERAGQMHTMERRFGTPGFDRPQVMSSMASYQPNQMQQPQYMMPKQAQSPWGQFQPQPMPQPMPTQQQQAQPIQQPQFAQPIYRKMGM